MSGGASTHFSIGVATTSPFAAAGPFDTSSGRAHTDCMARVLAHHMSTSRPCRLRRQPAAASSSMVKRCRRSPLTSNRSTSTLRWPSRPSLRRSCCSPPASQPSPEWCGDVNVRPNRRQRGYRSVASHLTMPPVTSLPVDPRDLAFQLYAVLHVEARCSRPRVADGSRETFDAVLDTARGIAVDLVATHDEPLGGLQLPHVVASAAIAWCEAAMSPPHRTPSSPPARPASSPPSAATSRDVATFRRCSPGAASERWH